jgi:hypothetical protein
MGEIMKTGILISKQENGIHGTPAYSVPVFFAKDQNEADFYMDNNILYGPQYYALCHVQFNEAAGES